MLSSHDNVLVTNHGDKPVIWLYDGRPIGIPAGQTVHVPFDVVRVQLGDPRSGEQARTAMDGSEKIRIASRADERARLTTLYGLGVRQQEEKRTITLDEVAPKVTVATIDGQLIDTVVSDPGGANPASIPLELNTQEAISAQVAQMQRQLDALLQQQKALEAQPSEGDDEIPQDTPTGRAKAGARQ